MCWNPKEWAKRRIHKETKMSLSIKERQLIEVSERMKELNVPARIRIDFECSGRIWNCLSPMGTYSALNSRLKNEVEMFEVKYNTTVFLVISTLSRAGFVASLIYVGRNEEEWKEEKQSIRNGYIAAYTINCDYDVCPEFNNIAFQRINNGGIIRLN